MRWFQKFLIAMVVMPAIASAKPPLNQRFPLCAYELLKAGDIYQLLLAARRYPMDFLAGVALGEFRVPADLLDQFSSTVSSGEHPELLPLYFQLRDMSPPARDAYLNKWLTWSESGAANAPQKPRELAGILQLFQPHIDELNRDWRKLAEKKNDLLSVLGAASFEQEMLAWNTPAQQLATVRLARLVASPECDRVSLDGTGAQLLAKVRAGWKQLRDYLYGGHNAQLAKIFVTGLGFPNDDHASSLAHIVSEESWTRRSWWLDSATGLSQFPGKRAPRPFTQVTAATSRSPLAQLLGPHSERGFFWNSFVAHDEPHAAYQLDLGRIRVATNYAIVDGNRVPKSLEVMVRDREWKGFYFEYVDREWFPSQTFAGQPIATACLRCHESEKSPGQLSPRPFFLKTKADFHHVGYLDDELIDYLLAF